MKQPIAEPGQVYLEACTLYIEACVTSEVVQSTTNKPNATTPGCGLTKETIENEILLLRQISRFFY